MPCCWIGRGSACEARAGRTSTGACFYTIRDLSAALRRSESAVKVALRTLEAAGLIRRERQGLGKANRLYLLTPVENDLSVGSNPIRQTGRNQPLNKNYINKNNRTYICGEDESL